jgi:carboxyl-terminal processing protease
MSARYRTWDRFTFVGLLLAAFAVGAVTERTGILSGISRYEPAGLGETFAPFWEAWNLVERHYVDRQAVQPRRMTQGAIQGMLTSLGDIGHTTFLTPEELRQLESNLEGHFEGVGARMTLRDRRPTVVETLPGSPARAAGLRPGDVLLEVEGKDVSHLPLDRIVQLVHGPAGTTVRLSVLRKGNAQPLQFSVARARVEIEDVTWHLLPGVLIAHLAVHEFGGQTDAQFRAALRQARDQGAKGLLLDLRGNPGGLRDQAVALTSEFLTGGNVFLEQDAAGKRTAVPVRPGGVATDLPVCVLIDDGTASAAEICAGALQDHGRGQLVGTRTFGTGTVLKPFALSDGSAVLLAVTEWLTPTGRQIWHQGISPDLEVTLPDGAAPLLPGEEVGLDAAALASSQDKQLVKAIEVLQRQIGGGGRSGTQSSRIPSPSTRALHHPRCLRIGPVSSESRVRCRPCSSKLPGASHASKAARKRGHSASMAAYQAVSRLRPL